MEVGRSCIELRTGQSEVLLDAGIKLTEKGTEYPVGLYEMSDIDAVFLSHAHLDHIGALPYLDHLGLDCQVFCTKGTKEIGIIMLEDAYKIGHFRHDELGYFIEDVRNAVSCMKKVKLREKGKVNDIEFEYFDAGHIPGSSI